MYNIEPTDFGYMVTNDRGDIIVMAESYEAAEDYINDYKAPIKEQSITISPYKQFDNYTQGLKGKCWPDGEKFGTIYETPLNRFIKSFEKNTGFTVKIEEQYISGELFFIVTDVY